MNDSIVLNEHSGEWLTQAKQEIEILTDLIPSGVIKDIAHIGSTSVEGCIAKPIIDIAVLVDKISDGKKSVEILKSIGYDYWSDNPDQTHLFFVKGLPPRGLKRTHHIHFFEKERFLEHIRFKRILESKPGVLRQYQELKRDLAGIYWNDREAYTKIKGEYIQKVLNSEL